MRGFQGMIFDVFKIGYIVYLIYQRKELSQFRFQTQTAYGGDFGNVLVWSHSFETQLFPKSFELWPKGILRLWKLDSNNTLSVYAFGSFYFPFSPGNR